MSKFTKGTWELNKHFDVFSEDGQFIALCCIRYEKLGYHYIENIKQTKANARLIAAAPEMYELLKGELIPTSDYGGIISFERERKIKQLLARIDGDEYNND